MAKRSQTEYLWLTGLAGLALLAKSLYIPVKAEVAQLLMAHAWEQSLAGKSQVKPWPWADTWPLARLLIPALNQDFIVLGGSSGASLAFGPGHLTGSALPEEEGHIVLSAHRDTHFANLGALKVGEQLQLETKSGQLNTYTIQSIRIVDTEQESLWLDHSENQLTLVTCYPFDAIQAGGPLRYRIDAIRSLN